MALQLRGSIRDSEIPADSFNDHPSDTSVSDHVRNASTSRRSEGMLSKRLSLMQMQAALQIHESQSQSAIVGQSEFAADDYDEDSD